MIGIIANPKNVYSLELLKSDSTGNQLAIDLDINESYTTDDELCPIILFKFIGSDLNSNCDGK